VQLDDFKDCKYVFANNVSDQPIALLTVLLDCGDEVLKKITDVKGQIFFKATSSSPQCDMMINNSNYYTDTQ